MLEATDLTHARAGRTLFAGLGLTVRAGEAWHISGPNGSGKTTLLRLLAGLARPQQGQVRWQGQPIDNQRRAYHAALLWAGHATGSADDLTPLEHLHHTACLRGQRCEAAQALQALDRFGLADTAHRPTRTLSQGQRKRISLAALALPTRPALVLLDEPFSALDRHAITRLTEVLEQLLRLGSRLVYTTHQPQPLAAPGGLHALALGSAGPGPAP